MSTFPASLLRTLPALYATENEPLEQKLLRAKWFHIASQWTWYAAEGEWEEGDFLMFGLVVGHETEWGYFRLSDLMAEGWRIERDEWFKPCTWRELKQKEGVSLK